MPLAKIKRLLSSRASVRSKLTQRKVQSLPTLATLISVAALLTACEKLPANVYVLEAPQSIALTASASAQTVAAGAPLVLYASRTTQGTWKRIPSGELKPEQCWMAEVPPTEEAQVADNVLWRVEPASAAKFNTDFRANRTREVIFSEPGTYELVASTGAWCEPGRQVNAAALRVTVVRP